MVGRHYLTFKEHSGTPTIGHFFYVSMHLLGMFLVTNFPVNIIYLELTLAASLPHSVANVTRAAAAALLAGLCPCLC